MKKHVALLGCALLTAALAATACADETYQVEEITNSVYGQIAENQAKYAPKVTTLANGVQVQRTPTGASAGIYNTYFLNSDSRGCYACHTNLYNTMINMPMSVYWQPETHMHTIGAGQTEVDVMECVGCHQVSGGAAPLADVIHAIHSKSSFNAMGGSCQSCHSIGSDGSYELWDYVRYEKYMGISPVDVSTGEFTYDQTTLTDADDVFCLDWNHNDRDMMSYWGVVGGAPETSEEELRAWPMIVTGESVEEKNYTMGELIDMDISETRVMTMACEINAPTGSMVANCEVTGISVKKLMELSGVEEDAVFSYNEPFWVPYTTELSMCDLTDDNALLVYKINGEMLTRAEGFPVQIWIAGDAASLFLKNVSQLTVLDKTDDGTRSEEKHMYQPRANSPLVRVLNTEDGQIIKADEPYTIEGYAFALSGKVNAVEISMDQGASWTTFDTSDTDDDKWVYWRYTNTLPEGSYVFYVRAVDEGGNATPIIEKLVLNAQ